MRQKKQILYKKIVDPYEADLDINKEYIENEIPVNDKILLKNYFFTDIKPIQTL